MSGDMIVFLIKVEQLDHSKAGNPRWRITYMDPSGTVRKGSTKEDYSFNWSLHEGYTAYRDTYDTVHIAAAKISLDGRGSVAGLEVIDEYIYPKEEHYKVAPEILKAVGL